MICKDYNPEIQTSDALAKVLGNRGVKDIQKYLTANWDNVNSPETLDYITDAIELVHSYIKQNKKILVIVDCDCDGYTSAALLINFFYKLYPDFNIDYVMHKDKQHGMNDISTDILFKYDLIIVPDGGSGDYERHKVCKDQGIAVLVLDHHEVDRISQDAIIVNNQLCNYPNKQFSGVGIVWQFCRKYVKEYEPEKIDLPERFLDLLALGLMADMQSMLEIETKFLIWEGFKPENIRNPYISAMIDKNNFSLSKPDYKSSHGLACSPMGAAFFIIPFVNAMVRSGTPQEQDLIFKSMLLKYAFEEVPSTKRGHAAGAMETIVEQAIRVCTNVKNRQTKAETSGMEFLEKKMQDGEMLKSPTLIFKLEPGQVEKNLAGLVANKLANKYQRPCLVLTRVNEVNPETNQIENHYVGSGRGYSKTGPVRFKDQCQETEVVDYVAGHLGAFGISVDERKFTEFEEKLNQEFSKDISAEKIYFVDFVYDEDMGDNIKEQILTIADMNDYWGKDLDRALVCMKFHCTPAKFKIMASATLKFELNNGINIIKFGGTPDEMDFFSNNQVDVTAVCKCNKNVWNGRTSAQLIMDTYEINHCGFYF